MVLCFCAKVRRAIDRIPMMLRPSTSNILVRITVIADDFRLSFSFVWNQYIRAMSPSLNGRSMFSAYPAKLIL